MLINSEVYQLIASSTCGFITFFLTPMNYRSTINPTVSLGINQQISKTAVGSPRTSAPNKVLKGAGGGGGVSTYGAAMAFGLLKMEVCMISK